MAFKFADRIKETTITTGGGALTLAGAAAGYRSFAAVLSIADTCYYCIDGGVSGEWETGVGTYNTVFERTIILASSNSGSAVDFSAGTKDVFLTIASRQMEPVDLSGAGGDYPLNPGETAIINYTAASTVPLRLATKPGLYELTLLAPNPTAGNSSLIYLQPNNQAYTDQFAYNPVPGAPNYPENAFFISLGTPRMVSLKISTFTDGKFVSMLSSARTASLMESYIAENMWDDTTTLWTSLGTIVFPAARTGKIIVSRVI